MGNQQRVQRPFEKFTKEKINQIQISKTIFHQAFAHRDQDKDQPLVEALESGVGFIEFDVYCIDDVIFVAHDVQDLNLERTIATQYLDPLKMIIERNGGCIYKDDPNFAITLFVDIKEETVNSENMFNDYKKAYKVLQKLVIENYLDIVSHYVFATQKFVQKQVNLVITGHRQKKDIKNLQPIRVATIDGRIDDLYNSDEYYDLIDVVSDNFEKFFNNYKIRNTFPLSQLSTYKLLQDEKKQIEDWMNYIRITKKKFRLWGTKDETELWDDLLEVGGNDIIINTDRPKKLVSYFREKAFSKQSNKFLQL